jgi:hypothetical protein
MEGKTGFPLPWLMRPFKSSERAVSGAYQPHSVDVFDSETCSQTDSETRPWVRCCFHSSLQVTPALKSA